MFRPSKFGWHVFIIVRVDRLRDFTNGSIDSRLHSLALDGRGGIQGVANAVEEGIDLIKVVLEIIAIFLITMPSLVTNDTATTTTNRLSALSHPPLLLLLNGSSLVFLA